MRTCPNRHCRLIHEDSVGQCPECGASMSRTPDAERDPNSVLFAAQARAANERALEQRLASRRNRGHGQEFDLGAGPEVNEAADEVAAGILTLYGLR